MPRAAQSGGQKQKWRNLAMFGPAASNDISPEEWRILRAHCEWSARYAMLWVIVTVIIFGGIFIMLDIVGAGERVEVPSLILLLASRHNDGQRHLASGGGAGGPGPKACYTTKGPSPHPD